LLQAAAITGRLSFLDSLRSLGMTRFFPSPVSRLAHRSSPGSYWTFTVPSIPEWFVQWYAYVPTVSNVRLFEPELKFPMLVGEPAVVNVTLCAAPASLFQVTVPPFAIVTVDGEKENVE
jgi:hypothetical protein